MINIMAGEYKNDTKRHVRKQIGNNLCSRGRDKTDNSWRVAWPGLVSINKDNTQFIYLKKKTNIEIFFKIFYFIFILTH